MKQKCGREFFMPAEFSAHEGTFMIWPDRGGSWRYGGRTVHKAFCDAVSAILPHEKVFVAVNSASREIAEKLLPRGTVILDIPSDDAWARDTAPTFVKKTDGKRVGICWGFNAWGGEFNGLYRDFANDAALGKRLCAAIGAESVDKTDFILEGGSIHTDGEGTLITTDECILSQGRNPSMTAEEIDCELKKYTGAEKIIHLPYGIYNDETDGHVDNIAAFTAPGELVLSWTDDKNDPQYSRSAAAYEILNRETDAAGRRLKVHKLPLPEYPIVLSEEDISGYEYSEGEDTREPGERMAASYANFYFANGIIMLPQFGGKNAESDSVACNIMKKICPDREIFGVDASEFIRGGGNIHCLTQQIPKED